MDTSRRNQILVLVVSLALPLAAGLVGALFTTPAIPGWYAALSKPSITPPAWVFGPAWTLLYVLMGLSLFLVVRSGLSMHEVRWGMLLFAAQLVVNVFWSMVFFGWHALFGALAVLFVLIVLILATIVVFARISRPAAWLLVPYLCWCCFAALLNALVAVMNSPWRT
jgi:tryptophan-rich sensory protein